MVADIPHLESRFLANLADHRLFRRFTGFDESRQAGVKPARPVLLAGQQAPVGELRHHDDGRVRPRKGEGPARVVGADSHVTGLPGLGDMAADTAKAMVVPPSDEPGCMGEERGIAAQQLCGDAVEFLEGAAFSPAGKIPFVEMRHVDGKQRADLVDSEKDRLHPGIIGESIDVARRQKGRTLSAQQAASAVNGNEPGRGIVQSGGDPRIIPAQLAGTIDQIAAVVGDVDHETTFARGPPPRNQACVASVVAASVADGGRNGRNWLVNPVRSERKQP